MKIALTLFALAVFLAASTLSTSCSTAAGLGRDLQTMGRGLEKVAN